MNRSIIVEVIEKFLPKEQVENAVVKPIETGLINSTFKVEAQLQTHYVLQQINTDVFPNPAGIQGNIEAVSGHLKDHNYPKNVLSIIRTLMDEPMYIDADKSVWRMFEYIQNSSHFDVVPSAKHAFEAAKALGEFHQYLSSFQSEKLTIPIQGFLDFQQRRNHFETALKKGSQSRNKSARFSIQFIENHRFILDEYQKIESSLPMRVIHGDPKISNFLFRENSMDVLCLIDWDTIMQGSVLYDFGDMVRSFTNRKEESDATASPIFDTRIFDAIVEGYLVHQRDLLSQVELENLLLGAKTVVYIQAMRFLTDYLNGDIYFKTNYPEQNLDRTNNQIHLLEALMSK